jgi:hypothetical protein
MEIHYKKRLEGKNLRFRSMKRDFQDRGHLLKTFTPIQSQQLSYREPKNYFATDYVDLCLSLLIGNDDNSGTDQTCLKFYF